jgi:hypothetical protein
VEFPPLGGTPCGGFHRAGLFLRGQQKREKRFPLRALRLERSARCCLRHTCNLFCAPISKR